MLKGDALIREVRICFIDEIKKAYHKNIGYIDESVFNEYLETLVDEGFDDSRRRILL